MFCHVLINFGVLIIPLFYTAIKLHKYKLSHSVKTLCNKWNTVTDIQAKVIIIVDYQ